jgi:cell wall-associated NlpC family hydrolase
MSKVADLIALATTQLGKPYVYGDEGPNTFDCSGLMQYVFGLVGIRLPRTAAQQQKSVTRVASPVPGDLVFYGAPAHHVALYIGGGRSRSRRRTPAPRWPSKASVPAPPTGV